MCESEVFDALGHAGRTTSCATETRQRVLFGRLVGRALDIYSATFMALIKPLPAEQCPMAEALRPAFEAMDDTTRAALDPILLAHRDAIYAQHLELPLTL